MRRIDPAMPTDIETLLIHGLNNVGKTHLLGSILAHEKQYGEVVYINTQGEPFATLTAYDLTDVKMVEVGSVDEIPTLVKDIGHVHCIVLDSLQGIGEQGNTKVTGGKYIVGAKEDHGRDWAKLKYEGFTVLRLLKGSCDFLVASCPSAQHENQITHVVRVVPDMPGLSEKLVGKFNFVGYMTATPLNATVTKRMIEFQTRTDVVTRWNAPKGILKGIEVQSGLDCWEPIKQTIIGALEK